MFCHFVRKLREEKEVVTPVCVIVNKRLVIVVFIICIHVVVLWSTRPRPINHTNTVLRSSADSPYFMAYDVYVYIIYGHRAISCIGHRRGAKDKAVQRLYGDRTEIVRGS